MALPDPSTITGKGTTLKATLAFVETRWGREGIDRVLAGVDEETRGVLTSLLLPSSRYQIKHLVNLCETVDKVYGRGDMNLCWDLGKFAGDYELKLLHRVFLNVLSLQYWLKMAGVAWRIYYSAGTLVPKIGETGGEVSLTGFNPISKAFCYRFGGWVWHAIEVSKHRNVQMRHSACVLDGDPACVWTATWNA